MTKATADIRAAAQVYTDKALAVLVNVMTNSESDAARVMAANSVLDRGYGKPKQSMDVDATVTTFVGRVENLVIDPAASGSEGVSPTP